MYEKFTKITMVFPTPQIVRQDRTMEQIVFPIPEICEYLTEETKHKVYYTAERDDQGSKVTDYFERVDDMFAEMKWQKKLRGGCVVWIWGQRFEIEILL